LQGEYAVTDRETERAVQLLEEGLGPVGYVPAEAASWRATDHMYGYLQTLVAGLPEGRTVRYDVATLTATMALMPAAVPALRAALARAARTEGSRITAEARDTSHDQLYVLGG
jgi:hypothetical protein